jgi:ATP-dependent Lon protease, bacterial type
MRIKTISVIASFILFAISSTVKANEEDGKVYLNKEGMTLDSLINIVNDPTISYKEKMEIFYRCNYKRNSQQEKQTSVINTLLSESKLNKDINGILYCYIYLADLNNEWNHEELFNNYINSAEAYAENATNPLALAGYHYTKGTQAINAPYGKKEGYKQFEKAIEYYSQVDSVQDISYILYNLTAYTTNQPDSLFSKRLIGKIESILQKKYSPFIEFSLSTMKSDLYNIYFNATEKECMLDSAIFYEKNRIALYCSNRGELPDELDYDILQSYLLIAEYCSMKKDADWKYINDCIDKARSMGYMDDSYIMSRIFYTEALSLFEQKKYNEAEIKIIEAEKYLSQQIEEGESIYTSETFYSDQATYASLYSKILSQQGKFKESLEYNRKKNDLKLKMRDIETRELEYLYSTEKEESKIEQLKVVNANQSKSTTMLVIAVILLITTMVLLWLWFYTVKKSIKRRSALIKAEKEEAELNLKIKEEQAVKTQLEKYEVFADYRLKELELDGKNKAMQQLLKDKENLDNQIEAYTQKIKDFELNNDRKQEQVKNDEHLNGIIIEDISKLIHKKLQNNGDYIDLLNKIDGQYISTLKNSYDGNLSVPYIKYCICFAIGLEIGEVSECFSIEQSSVHMVRYRLKKKFDLDNNDDLDVFLRRMNSALSSNNTI